MNRHNRNSGLASRTQRATARKSAAAIILLVCLAASYTPAQDSRTAQAVQHTSVAQEKTAATHARLCELTECDEPAPAITGIDPSSAITPGGQMVVIGADFSRADYKSGDIILTIGSKRAIQFRPSAGYQQPYREAQLKVLGWSNGHAYGEIPKDISGVMDGPAFIQVRRSDGKISDPFPVQFTATRIGGYSYPTTDMKWDSCSTNADENQCNGWSDYPGTGFDKYLNSIVGAHVKFLKKTGTPQSGVDTYKFSLKNGWVWNQDPGLGDAPPPCSADLVSLTVSDSTPTGGRIRAEWQATCEIPYFSIIMIHGPAGVPWK